MLVATPHTAQQRREGRKVLVPPQEMAIRGLHARLASIVSAENFVGFALGDSGPMVYSDNPKHVMEIPQHKRPRILGPGDSTAVDTLINTTARVRVVEKEMSGERYVNFFETRVPAERIWTVFGFVNDPRDHFGVPIWEDRDYGIYVTDGSHRLVVVEFLYDPPSDKFTPVSHFFGDRYARVEYPVQPEDEPSEEMRLEAENFVDFGTTPRDVILQ